MPANLHSTCGKLLLHQFFCVLLPYTCHCLLLLQYAEMEMRHRFVNHARNVWDRAVSLLPRIDQLWYKYVHMEEMLKETAKARLIFDRWMAFEPDHASWMAYIKVGVSTCSQLQVCCPSHCAFSSTVWALQVTVSAACCCTGGDTG